MRTSLRTAITKINEREGVSVCDACFPSVHAESTGTAEEESTPTASDNDEE